jgi:multidrug efflux pump subunit AcrA (membrane-fusion protein)
LILIEQETININMKNIYLLCALALLSCGKKDTKDAGVATDTVSSNVVKQIVGIASIEPQTRLISLYAETGGTITKINYDINDNVKKGDVILEQERNVEKRQLEQAVSKLATQRSAIEVYKAQLASLKVKLENARVNFERNKNLYTSGSVTKQTLDDSEFTYNSQKSDAAAAEANVFEQENKLHELQADIDYNKSLVERKLVRAPLDGKLLSMDVRLGNYITSSQSICDFAPVGPLIAVTEVDELYATDIKDGLFAYIRPQGQLDTIAKGRIILTSPYLHKKSLFSDAASDLEDRRVREVRVLLDPSDKVLIGNRVECVILLDTTVQKLK